MNRIPVDLNDILSEIAVPDGDAFLDIKLQSSSSPQKPTDIFEEHKREGWNKEKIEARCDFSKHVRLTRRASVFFISLWQKSIYGRTLTDIKADDSMVDFFASELVPLIEDIVGPNLKDGGWCLITAPRRRHTVRNFATRIAAKMAGMLHIPFYEDVFSCHTKQRINAVFSVNTVPQEENIIGFDDICNTGSTLASMKRALEPYRKNMIFITGINNKL